MSDLTVTLEGDKELIRTLKRLGVDVRAALDDALREGAEVVQRAANPKAPSPHVEIGDPDIRGDAGEIKVGPDDDHWYHRFIETGASGHTIGASGQVLTLFGEEFVTGSLEHFGFPAKPFLRPALDENNGRASDAMGDELRKAIERAAR